MTHDELLAKAIERLRIIEPMMTERMRDVTAARLPKRRFRDAVVIDFSSDENRGTIQVVMERETGAVIGTQFVPPKPKGSEDPSKVSGVRVSPPPSEGPL